MENMNSLDDMSRAALDLLAEQLSEPIAQRVSANFGQYASDALKPSLSQIETTARKLAEQTDGLNSTIADAVADVREDLEQRIDALRREQRQQLMINRILLGLILAAAIVAIIF